MNLEKEIEKHLKEGYEWFKKNKLDCFTRFAFMNTEFYNSELRGKISYPPYQLGVQLIANYSLMKYLAENGLSLDKVFPGDYSESVELEKEFYEVRTFESGLYRKGEKIGNITFSFSHYHDRYGFHKSPTVRIKYYIEK